MKRLLGAVGVLTCLGSVVMVSAAIGDLISGTGGETSPGVLVGLLIFFGGTAIASGYLAKSQLSDGGAGERQTAHAHETTILELAMKHGGQLNIAQVAALTPMSVEDAQRAMKRLQSQGVAEIEFTTEGEVFYQFAGLDNLSKLTSGGEASGPLKSERRARPISKREV